MNRRSFFKSLATLLAAPLLRKLPPPSPPAPAAEYDGVVPIGGGVFVSPQNITRWNGSAFVAFGDASEIVATGTFINIPD